MTATDLIPPLIRRRADLLLPTAVLGTASLTWRTAVLALGTGSMPNPAEAFAQVAPAVCVDLLVGNVILLAAREARARIAASNWPHQLTKLTGALALLLVVSLVVYVCAARLLDYACYYYGGRHLDATFFRHAEGAALGMRPGSELLTAGVLLLGPLAVGAALTVVLLRRVASSSRKRTTRALPLLAVLVAGVGLLIAGSTGAPRGGDRSANASSAWSFPELAIWDALMAPSTSKAATRAPLHPVVVDKLERFGHHLAPDSEYPLIQPSTFQTPFPHAALEGSVERPNVVLLFFESLSSALCSVYPNCDQPGLTPHLEDLARHGHVVEGFRNSATPTLPGIKATLSSYFATSEPMAWADDSRKNIRGLPEILDEFGYASTFIHQVEKGYIKTDATMRSLGFDEVRGEAEVGRALREEPLSWGYSDHQMFRYLVHQLDRDAFEEPFLVTMPTLDSHAPFRRPDDGVAYGDGDNELLDTIHSADHAFGAFWDWFKSSRYRDNTIVIAVADHAMFPGTDYRKIRATEDIYGKFFDEIALVIYNPTRDMSGRSNVLSSQVDLAPTILHMLDLDVANHFEGESIFGERRDHPGVIGMNHELFYVAQMSDGELTEDWFELRDVERPGGVPFDRSTPALTRDEMYRYFQWKDSVHDADRIWR